MRVLGLITARGGSKGVPRKNVRLLNGKPLLQYTAASASEARCLSRLVISTDDAEIADVARRCGVDVPFMRPSALALDTSPTFPVLEHALVTLREQGDEFDAVCLLQPTNPLRRASDIDACVEMLRSTGADSVISVLPVPHEYNPKWVYWRQNDGDMKISTGDTEPISRRQDLPPAFHRDGSVYVTRSATVLTGKSLYGARVHGYESDPRFSVNIDTEEDWKHAEERLRRLGLSDELRTSDGAGSQASGQMP